MSPPLPEELAQIEGWRDEFDRLHVRLRPYPARSRTHEQMKLHRRAGQSGAQERMASRRGGRRPEPVCHAASAQPLIVGCGRRSRGDTSLRARGAWADPGADRR